MDGSCMPREIIEEILVRLPASSLVRLQEVCRQWRNTIQEPRFIEAHRERACKAYPPGMVVSSTRISDEEHNRQTIKIFDEAFRMKKIWSMERGACIVGSCNGLLLFARKATFDLVNPTTGDYLTLPKECGRRRGLVTYCFGYHPRTKQYKVTQFDGKHGIAKVYTVGDSSWRWIKCPSLTTYNVLGCLSVNGSGTIYLSTARDYGEKYIRCAFSFDLKEETLTMLRPPSCELYKQKQLDIHDMKIIDGSPCLVTSSYAYHACQLEIWTLESPQEHRWSHRYSIQLPRGCMFSLPRPIFILGGKILLNSPAKRESETKLCCHELDLKGKNCIEHDQLVKLKHAERKEYWIGLFDYIETLVPLNIYAGSHRKHQLKF